jgi:adenosylhomocysteine nucleosidase
MKKIGIIVAMDEELKEIQNIMKNEKIEEILNLQIYKGSIGKKEIVLVKSGVGKVNAARVTQILIDNFEIEYIINVGSAGALNPILNIGDIVIGKKLVQHDFDITAFGHTKGYITGVGDYIYSDDNLIKKLNEARNNINDDTFKIKLGIIATGDIFCTEVEMKNKIYAKFKADCVEMEGAAIAQVSYLNKIPFVVIRSISDSPNGKNAIIFDQFIQLASKRCAQLLQEMMRKE